MALVLDPIYLVNLILAVIIVVIGYMSYRLNRNRIPLYIAIGFLGFSISHLAFVLGLKDALENYLIFIRILAYLIILSGLYLSWLQTKTYITELSQKNMLLEGEIASRKRAEKQLRESEETYRSIFDNTLTPMIIVADDMTVYLPNTQFREMSGYAREELEGRMKITRFYRDDEKEMAKRYHQARRINPLSAPGTYEFHFVDAKGNIRDVVVNVGMIPGTRRSLLSFLDISERKHTEKALQESEKKFRVLAETSAAAVFVYKADMFLYANPATERITGYSRDELMRMDFWDWVHPDFKSQVRERGMARLRGEDIPERYEISLVTKGGEERWGDVRAGLIGYNGKPAVLVTMFDSTDRKMMEEALLDSKLQAELYVDVMSHDISNMNQVAMGYLEIAATAPAGDFGKYLARSQDALNNSARLIENVRKLQRARSGRGREKIDVGKMLEEVAAEYAAVPGKDVAIRYTPANGCFVMADSLLKDVFSNIMGNAVKHSDSPVTVVIGVSLVNAGGRECWRISFEDNGPGVPDEMKGRIFNRLQRGMTKSRGHGLGLHLVKTLVEGYGGSVRVEDRVPSDPAKGSCFVVILPAHAPAPSPP